MAKVFTVIVIFDNDEDEEVELVKFGGKREPVQNSYDSYDSSEVECGGDARLGFTMRDSIIPNLFS